MEESLLYTRLVTLQLRPFGEIVQVRHGNCNFSLDRRIIHRCKRASNDWLFSAGPAIRPFH